MTGWVLKRSEQKLAERLKKAVEAGKVFDNIYVEKFDGPEYLYARMYPLGFGKDMDKALKKLGF